MVALFLLGRHFRIMFGGFEQAVPLYFGQDVPLPVHGGERFALCRGKGTPGRCSRAARRTDHAQQQEQTNRNLLSINNNPSHALLYSRNLIYESFNRQVARQNRYIRVINLLLLNMLPVAGSR